MVVIDQILWAALQPSTQQEVAEHCLKRGILGFAAEVDDGELRVEEFCTATGR